MSDMPGREWMRRGGLRGAIDGGTGFVVLLWLGILLLVPSRPPGEISAPSAPFCMIRAWPEPLAQVPLALRPELVTLPSAVSFGAGGPSIDSLQGVPVFRRFKEKPLPTVEGEQQQMYDETSESALRLAAEALAPIPIAEVLTGTGGNTNPASMTRWRVVCSPSLGNTQLSSTFMETFKLPGDVKHLEADLWMQFDKNGRPLELFIEKSDNGALALELVRQLWNPANWTGASGQGRVTVRYRAGTGGTNANKDN